MKDGHGKFQYLCPISGLENLEELYLNKNRLKDLPTVFQNFKKLKIIGLDWFSYLRLPKILEEQRSIQLLKNNSQI
jgi:Leucine-rich repeat (LRR) protein